LTETYKTWVDQTICSTYCPCPISAKFKKSDITQKTLNGFGRYMSGGGYGSSTGTGNVLLTWSSATSGTYDTYAQCYRKVISKDTFANSKGAK